MKKIKNLLIVISVLLISLLSLNNYSYATHDTAGIYLGLYNRGNERPTGYYTVGNEQSNGSHPVIKIVEYNIV